MKRILIAAVVAGGIAVPVFGAGNAPDYEVLSACGAERMQDLVGQSFDGVRARFPDRARIIPPNSPVTQDYRPDRLNADLDGDGLITRIWCG